MYRTKEDHEIGNLRVPKGTQIEVDFLVNRPKVLKVTVPMEGKKIERIIPAHEAWKWISRFTAQPTSIQIRNWISKKEAKTITGKTAPLYGVGTDGSPSWLLVLKSN